MSHSWIIAGCGLASDIISDWIINAAQAILWFHFSWRKAFEGRELENVPIQSFPTNAKSQRATTILKIQPMSPDTKNRHYTTTFEKQWKLIKAVLPSKDHRDVNYKNMSIITQQQIIKQEEEGEGEEEEEENKKCNHAALLMYKYIIYIHTICIYNYDIYIYMWWNISIHKYMLPMGMSMYSLKFPISSSLSICLGQGAQCSLLPAAATVAGDLDHQL